MLIAKYTIETDVSKEALWNIGQDVKNWNTWDSETEYSSIDGEFKEGTKGVWKAKNGPLLSLKIIQAVPLTLLVVEFKLFMARIVATRWLTESAGKVRITQQLEIKGPLAMVYAYHIGRSMKENLPHQLESLVKQAKSLSRT